MVVATPLQCYFHSVIGHFTFPSAQLQLQKKGKEEKKKAPALWDASDFCHRQVAYSHLNGSSSSVVDVVV